MLRTLTLILLVSSLSVANAQAGVRGGKFTGTINSDLGNSAEATLNFAAIGNARTEVQVIGGIPNAHTGTYVEFDFKVFSFWKGTFTGASTFEASGFCFFNFVSTYDLTNSGASAGDGWLWRTGIADVAP